MTREVIMLSPAAPVSMADEWYAIASPDHFWMEWRFRALLHHLHDVGQLTPGSGGRFLEIGCGHGAFIQQLERDPSFITDGCDLNLYALQQIPPVKGNIYVYDIYKQQAEMLGKYAGVFLLDVIEHIDDDRSFLEASHDHVQPGGLVVVNVPALQTLFSKYDVAAGHKRRYTRKSLRAALEASGLEPLFVGYWGLSLIPIALLRKLYLAFVAPDKIIERGFKPPVPVVNKLFKAWMKVEMAIFNSPPLGTSVLAIARKRLK
jgi:SAM-dependent methyltransferase